MQEAQKSSFPAEVNNMANQTPAALDGMLIGNYRVGRRIGKGGMGTVHEAEHVLTQRKIAVKFLMTIVQSEEEARLAQRRFEDEALILGGLKHPNLIEFLGSGVLPDGRFYIMMEYCEGITLKQFLVDKGGRLEPDLAVDLIRQIALALMDVHKHNIVHRDLTPRNVMVLPEPSTPQRCRVKILDFGIAKTLGSDRRTSTQAFPTGTCQYMSPEQWQSAKSLDVKADIYALGLIFYELLVGDSPYHIAEESPHRWMDAHVNCAPRSLRLSWSKAPQMWVRLLAQMLDKMPDYRPTAEEVYACLNSGQEIPKRRGPIDASHAMGFLLTGALLPGVSSMGIKVNDLLLRPPIEQRNPRSSYRLPKDYSKAEIAAMAERAPKGMLLIPPLQFLQGETEQQAKSAYELCLTDNNPTHCPVEANRRGTRQRFVSLSPFYIDRTEQTNEQVMEIINRLPASVRVDQASGWVYYPLGEKRELALFQLGNDAHKGFPELGSGLEFVKGTLRVRPGFEKRPMVKVTQQGASLLCDRDGKELPTEAQWEAAARGTDGRLYPWGNSPPQCEGVQVARSTGLLCSQKGMVGFPVDVGTSSLDISPFGLTDMGGNVLEWTRERFVAVYQDCGDCTNPGANKGGRSNDETAFYAVRGGSFRFSRNVARATSRTNVQGNENRPSLGYRCVMEATSDRGS